MDTALPWKHRASLKETQKLVIPASGEKNRIAGWQDFNINSLYVLNFKL